MDTDGICITLQKNFSWLTSGRGFVNRATEESVGKLFITAKDAYLIASNIEAERLQEEESCQGLQVLTFPWYEPEKLKDLYHTVVSSGEFRMDSEPEIEAHLKKLRIALCKKEEDALKQLGKVAAEVLEQIAFNLKVGISEHEVAGQIGAQCLARGIEPIVNLVAFDERVFSRRHPLPTSKILDKYAMLVLGARRQGQIVSVTRLVHFGALSDELVRKHQAVAEIDAQLIQHTRPGATYKALFKVMKDVYKEQGYSDEWTFHHQGGLTGYNTREQLLLPNVEETVEENQAFAWNPSIAGVKSEDTLIVKENKNEIISFTGNYPMIETAAGGLKRPGILVRAGVFV